MTITVVDILKALFVLAALVTIVVLATNWPKGLDLQVAMRYLRSRRSSRLISLITVIAVGGVTIGVMALVIVLGVMNGMQNDLREKILVSDLGRPRLCRRGDGHRRRVRHGQPRGDEPAALLHQGRSHLPENAVGRRGRRRDRDQAVEQALGVSRGRHHDGCPRRLAVQSQPRRVRPQVSPLRSHRPVRNGDVRLRQQLRPHEPSGGPGLRGAWGRRHRDRGAARRSGARHRGRAAARKHAGLPVPGARLAAPEPLAVLRAQASGR